MNRIRRAKRSRRRGGPWRAARGAEGGLRGEGGEPGMLVVGLELLGCRRGYYGALTSIFNDSRKRP